MLDNVKIGNFIVKERKNKGLTQYELANKLYITRAAISKWERGISMPDYESLLKLCEILDVSVSEILNGERIKKI